MRPVVSKTVTASCLISGSAPAINAWIFSTVVLLSSWDVVQTEIDRVLGEAAAAGGGHIFNLGHGVLPQIAPEMLTRVVDYVHWVSSATR